MANNKKVEIILESEHYPKEAVVTTCCQFLQDGYVFLSRAPRSKNDIKVTLTPKQGSSLTAEEFKNELMHNALRYNIAQRNKDIREYIIKTALLYAQNVKSAQGASSVETTQDSTPAKKYVEPGEEDWKEDPLGIAIPWEEKGKKKKAKIKKRKKRC